jgi:hypothetical protein
MADIFGNEETPGGYLTLGQILNIIQTQYPEAIPFLQADGVFDVYVRYIQSQQGQEGNPPWTPQQMMAELKKTPYYQNTPSSKIEWDLMSATSPADARQSAEQMFRLVNDLKSQLGLDFDPQMGFDFVKIALEQGWDPGEVKYHMLASVNKKMSGGGAIGTSAAEAQKMAEAYGLPLSDEKALEYGQQLQQGALDAAGLQGKFMEQAKALFPALQPFLEQGQTVRDYAEPYFQMAVQELGIQPNQIHLQNPKWMELFVTANDKGEQRIRTMQEALKYIRTDAAMGYDTSSNATKTASTLAENLMQRFGAAG